MFALLAIGFDFFLGKDDVLIVHMYNSLEVHLLVDM